MPGLEDWPLSSASADSATMVTCGMPPLSSSLSWLKSGRVTWH